MRFLCVVPRFVIKGGFYEFPLGMGYVSAVLKSGGHEVFGLNLCESVRPIPELIKESVRRFDIDAVCAGGLVTYYPSIDEIIKSAKSAKKDIITIIGGGLVTCAPEMMLENLNFSYGVIGEAEDTLRELAKRLKNGESPETVKGIVYRNEKGEIQKTAPRPPVANLDSVPFTDYESFDIDEYLGHLMPNDVYYLHIFDKPRALPMISSRSCPFKCDFCYHPLGAKYRQRSLDNFFQELEILLGKYHLNILPVLDELLSADNARLEEFCQRIKQYKLKWMTQLRVHPVSAGMLSMMKDSGCFYLSVGLESANAKVLKSMRKNITRDQMSKALRLMRKTGIGIQGNFIFGDRAETSESFNETLSWWKTRGRYGINLGVLTPYPNSELYLEAREKGIIKDPLEYIKAGCPNVNLTEMPAQEYRAMLARIDEIKCDSKYFARPESVIVKNRRADPLKGQIWDIEFKCAFCGHVSRIRNYNMAGARSYDRLLNIFCRNCNSRHVLQDERIEPFVQPERIRKKVEALAKEWKSKRLRICLYGAGRHTKDIMNWTSLSDAGVVGIIDDAAEMRGKIIGGAKVFSPVETGFLKPDVILVSSSLAEKEIYNKIRHLEERGVKIFTLYKNCGSSLKKHG